MKNNTITISELRKELDELSDPGRAKASAWFFKTGQGEYGEGDVFIGIKVPAQRKIARKYKTLDFKDLKELLKSRVHEYRFVALEILVMKYEKGDDAEKKKIVKFYLSNKKGINNWDLVDTSAPYILGDYLTKKERTVLYKMALSDNVWHRRISIISTAGFIKNEDYKDTLKLAKILLKDKHDLIHKAVGWMLREIGKKSPSTEEEFLKIHSNIMPRTMLRYAIEKFPEQKRKYYLGLRKSKNRKTNKLMS